MPKFCVKIDIDLCIVREGSTFSSMTLIYFLRLVQVIDITNFGVLILPIIKNHDIVVRQHLMLCEMGAYTSWPILNNFLYL